MSINYRMHEVLVEIYDESLGWSIWKSVGYVDDYAKAHEYGQRYQAATRGAMDYDVRSVEMR